MKAIVTGMIATYPLGGVAWDYGHYALSLERLGFEVFYLEDTGIEHYIYDPITSAWIECYQENARFLKQSLQELSTTLGERWHYRAANGETFGLAKSTFDVIVADADILINVSGGCILREEYRRAARTVFIDTDPGWNHFVTFPWWDSLPTTEREQGFRAHDHFFTYALRLGCSDCPLKDFGLVWHPTLPPVLIDRWQPTPPGAKWTSVMTWNPFKTPVMDSGRRYGAKDLEFHHIESLPSASPASHELALNSPFDEAPREILQRAGWNVIDGRNRSATVDTYHDYIQGSRGELSIAKNVYVATRCGWFSSRSVCYLAAGRPVILQDTGYADVLPSEGGLLPFRSSAEALAAVTAVESDYETHARAARDLALSCFDGVNVVGEVLTLAGLQ